MDESELRRGVRPNFAEDVYGDRSANSDADCVENEMSNSNLAQRRQAILPKLKQFKGNPSPGNDGPSEASEIVRFQITFF